MYEAKPERRELFSKLISDEKVQKALAYIEADQERCKEELKKLVVIEAPSCHEEARAAVFADMLRAQNLEDVHISDGGCVVSLRKGTTEGKKVLIEGHMDTVFPFGTVKGVEEKDGVLYAPGIGDDTRALTMLLCISRALDAAGIRTVKDVVFAGTTREEGLGGLGGMKDLLNGRDDICTALSVDNHDMGGICYQATIGETWEFTVHGKAGHSYGAFGTMSNAIHAASRAVAKIADIKVPEKPRTTFCVSNFHAGNMSGVHAFAPEASVVINFRSNGEEAFAAMKKQIFDAFETAVKEENECWNKDTLTYDYRPVSITPGGIQDEHCALVEAAQMSLETLEVKSHLIEGGSTNANISISKGIPALCMGRGFVPEGQSGNIRNHSVEEFFPLFNAHKAIQHALLVLLAAAGVDGLTQPIE